MTLAAFGSLFVAGAFTVGVRRLRKGVAEGHGESGAPGVGAGALGTIGGWTTVVVVAVLVGVVVVAAVVAVTAAAVAVVVAVAVTVGAVVVVASGVAHIVGVGGYAS